MREQVLMLRRRKYDGFNDQHFTEKLEEVEGLRLSRETFAAYCVRRDSARHAGGVHPSTASGGSGRPRLVR
jgi:hypothetical protein